MQIARTRNRDRKRGFTLIEIMVVVVILGILAAAVVPKLIGRSDEAKVTRAQTDIATLGTQLEQFYLHMDRYPTTEEGLTALMTQPADDEEEKWKGPYLKTLSKDPWGRDYIYESPGTVNTDSYDLLSYGQDGQEGGENFAADIKSWTDEEDAVSV